MPSVISSIRVPDCAFVTGMTPPGLMEVCGGGGLRVTRGGDEWLRPLVANEVIPGLTPALPLGYVHAKHRILRQHRLVMALTRDEDLAFRRIEGNVLEPKVGFPLLG